MFAAVSLFVVFAFYKTYLQTIKNFHCKYIYRRVEKIIVQRTLYVFYLHSSIVNILPICFIIGSLSLFLRLGDFYGPFFPWKLWFYVLSFFPVNRVLEKLYPG